MIRAALLEPIQSRLEESYDLFMRDLLPVYERYWEEEMQSIYEHPFSPAVQSLFPLWINGTVKAVVARDGGNVRGFVVGQVYRPMTYEARVFHVNDYYFNNDTNVKDELQQFILGMLPVLGCGEIWAETRGHLSFDVSRPEWRVAAPYTVRRWVR